VSHFVFLKDGGQYGSGLNDGTAMALPLVVLPLIPARSIPYIVTAIQASSMVTGQL